MFLKLSEIFKYLDATPDSRCIVEGEQVLHANHVILCGKKSSSRKNLINIAGLCLQTSALQGEPHQIEGSFSIADDVKIKEMKCSCKAGLSGTCKHISAILLNCTRMDISTLELLSSTDVECYWKRAKSDAKEMYKPVPISDYPCLVKTRSKVEVVSDLTEDQMRNCLQLVMKAEPDCNISKHCSRKRKQSDEVLPIHSKEDSIPTYINDIHKHCSSSDFLINLAKEVLLENFELRDCCKNKWKFIEKCNSLQGLLLSQNSEEWFRIRKFRITGSNCYSIFTYNMSNSEECWQRKTKQCFFPKKFTNEYVEHGKNQEKNALQAYKQCADLKVIENLGIVIDKNFPWLGFSPDALVMDGETPVKLVEIKCPFIGKTKDTNSFPTACRYLKVTSAGLELSRKHPYYGQIQLGLSLMNLKICDLILYSSFSKEYMKLEIPFDEHFAKELITSISEKYFRKMLHFVCKTRFEIYKYISKL